MVEIQKWLTRKQAAAYLGSIGYPMSYRYLAKLASDDNSGDGPPFNRTGHRTVVYSRAELDAWAFRKTKRVA